MFYLVFSHAFQRKRFLAVQALSLVFFMSNTLNKIYGKKFCSNGYMQQEAIEKCTFLFYTL